MDKTEQRLCDGGCLADLIGSLASQIAAEIEPKAELALVGVHSRGYPLAQRLAVELSRRMGKDIPVGSLDITLYRDDLERAARWPVLNGTNLPFSVEGKEILLVDDVLYTGRTVRAALNAICDLGRPSRIRLAVAVDRGHRELPISADFIGLKLPTSREQHILVRICPIDGIDEIVRVDHPQGAVLKRSAS